MLKSILLAATLGLASLTLADTASAQGLVGGAQQGYRDGNRAAGPVGGVVGTGVGAAVGTVNGALGVRPARYHRSYGRRRYRRRH